MKSHISTLILLPHSHTDIGYTHDPLVAYELHKRFIDRAIELCERTAAWPEGSRFRWTIEVMLVLEKWLETASRAQKQRLIAQIEEGNIALGVRYTHGMFLYSPGDIDWEIERVGNLLSDVKSPAGAGCLIQNDVNGFPRRMARAYHEKLGQRQFAMGLNTTMGVTPVPRSSAFEWELNPGQRLLTWNGYIYNRIKRFLHLDTLSSEIEGCWDEIVGYTPEDYPYSFIQKSGTIHDNVGPFVRLSEQVKFFNAQSKRLRIELMTFPQFMARVAEESRNLPVLTGEWNEAWSFGHGSMPQHLAMARRAQRRLEIVEELVGHRTPASPHIPSLVNRARFHLAMACEHTTNSHRTSGDWTLGDDAVRQLGQSLIHYTSAESYSMLAMRDAIRESARGETAEVASLLILNPADSPLRLHLPLNRVEIETAARSGQIEHITQLDREPTLQKMADVTDVRPECFDAPPRSLSRKELEFLDQPHTPESPARVAGLRTLAGGGFLAVIDADAGCLQSLRHGDGAEWIDAASAWKFAVPVIETLAEGIGGAAYAPFHARTQTREYDLKKNEGSEIVEDEVEQRDPSDQPWNPALRFDRMASAPLEVATIDRARDGAAVVRFSYGEESEVRAVEVRMGGQPDGILEIRAEMALGMRMDYHGVYLPLPFAHSGEKPTRFFVDACGDWFCADEDQLPGSASTFYMAHQGVAIEREDSCLYVVAPEAALWQLGGFTFGEPVVPLQRGNSMVASWLYNNYWFTNFPSCQPGRFSVRYLIKKAAGPFEPACARALYRQYFSRFHAHLLWPQAKYEPELPDGGLYL